MPDIEDSNLVGVLTKHLLSIAGGVVTLAGIVPLLTSESLKAWVKTHSYLVFIMLIFAVTAAFIVVDVILSRKRMQGTEHDRRIVTDFLERLPPHSQIIAWLKDSFISKSVPVKYIDKLDSLADAMRLNVIGLDSPQANQAYGALRDALQHFLELINFNLFANSDYTVLQNSPDWNWEDWMKASNEILQSRNSLVETYNDFVRTCHENGLD